MTLLTVRMCMRVRVCTFLRASLCVCVRALVRACTRVPLRIFFNKMQWDRNLLILFIIKCCSLIMKSFISIMSLSTFPFSMLIDTRNTLTILVGKPGQI